MCYINIYLLITYEFKCKQKKSQKIPSKLQSNTIWK